ncbi:MAG: hypothetical protein LC732_04230, partial [Acidobacteria bacterium]|nr:hypothetical protein [Acidobacteriota bacterium]
LALAGAFLLGRALGGDPAPKQPPMRLAVGIVDQAIQFGETTMPVAISPDGRTVVISALDAEKSLFLFAHDFTTGTTRKLEGTQSGYSATWNDDGTAVAFFAEGKLRTVPIAGGPPRALCDASPEGKAAWSGDTIVFSQFRDGPSIWMVPAAGGEPRQIVPPVEGKVPFWPEFLPDGRRFLFLYTVNPAPRRTARTHELMLASLDGGAPRRIATIDSRAVWVDTGHLLFVRDGTLFAQEFDLDAAELRGEAVALASEVHYFYSTGLAAFSVSRTGVLVWRAPREEAELTWVDRRGAVLSVVGRGRFEKGHLSDDGEQYATAVIDEKLGLASLWTWDLARGSGVRLGITTFDEKAPVWTPDGSLFFRTDENGPPDIHLRRAGTEAATPFLARPGVQEPLEVSPDGRWLFYGEANRTSGGDIWIVSIDDPASARPWLRTPASEWSPRFSPDGALVAYSSNASGTTEIYVRAFEGSGAPVRVSSEGG